MIPVLGLIRQLLAGAKNYGWLVFAPDRIKLLL